MDASSSSSAVAESGGMHADGDREGGRQVPQVPRLKFEKIQEAEDRRKLESLQAKSTQIKTKPEPTESPELQEVLPDTSSGTEQQAVPPMALLRAELEKLATAGVKDPT